jgi:chemotaxis-related protein WspD
MTTSDMDEPSPCWRIVGVSGDGSCEALIEHVHCRNCPVFARAAEQALERAATVPDANALAAIAESVQRPLRSRSALVFRIGANWLALDVAWVQQIAPTARPHAIPHRTGAGLAGLVNVQGQLVVAVDLRRLIGEPADPVRPTSGSRPRLVVVQLDGETWAFTSEDVPGVMTLPDVASAEPPATLRPPLAELAAGLFDWERGHLVLLRPDPLRAALRRAVPA